MFNALFAGETGQAAPEKNEQSSDDAGGPSTSTAANPLLNFWSVAAAVKNTVKARADELVKSVVETDWRTELSQFSREVGEEGKTLKVKTAELVEHIPEQVVHLEEKAEEALQHLPEKVHLPKDVGQTIEGVSVAFAQLGKSLFQGTKELIDELKDGVETEIAAASREGKRAARGKSTASAAAAKLSSVPAKYSRFEAEVAAMQRDSSTYCDEPEDAEEYARWRQGFSLAGVQADIGRITAENAFMAELQARLVPVIVEHQDFWSRYFYRLHKLQQKEEQRQQLAQRAKTLQEDEVPLGWGDEDEAAAALPEQQPAAAAAAVEQVAELTSQASAAVAAAPSATATSPELEAAPAALASGGAEASPAEEPSVAATAEAGSPALPSSSVAAAADAAAPAAVPVSQAAVEPDVLAAPSTPASRPAAEEPAESPAAASALHAAGEADEAAGSSSPSPSGHAAEAEAGQVEAETHAETSSDSSAKEWCVVTSGTKAAAPSPSAVGATAAGAAAAAELAGSSPRVAEVDGAVEAASPERVASPGAASPVAAPAAATHASPAAAPQPARGAKPGAEEEEVDEDWGNWD